MVDERSDRIAEDILGRIDAKQRTDILGPDGRPLFRPVVEDRTLTYAKDGEAASVDPEQLLMRGARMLRDGWSLSRIRSELDLITSGPQEITLPMLERALVNVGMPLLEQAIIEGREPLESQNVVGFEIVDEEESDG